VHRLYVPARVVVFTSFCVLHSLCFLFFSSSAHRRPLHSFPTRRSSDLVRPHRREAGRQALDDRAESEDLGVGVGEDEDHGRAARSEEHTSELQSLAYLVCRLLLEKKKNKHTKKNLQHNNTSRSILPTPD